MCKHKCEFLALVGRSKANSQTFHMSVVRQSKGQKNTFAQPHHAAARRMILLRRSYFFAAKSALALEMFSSIIEPIGVGEKYKCALRALACSLVSNSLFIRS